MNKFVNQKTRKKDILLLNTQKNVAFLESTKKLPQKWTIGPMGSVVFPRRGKDY